MIVTCGILVPSLCSAAAVALLETVVTTLVVNPGTVLWLPLTVEGGLANNMMSNVRRCCVI